MYRVTRLNPLSWAKTYTLAMLAIGFVVAALVLIPLWVIGVVAALASGDSDGMLGLGAMGLASLLFALVALAAITLMTFFISLLQALAFSWALKRTGGLQIDLALSDDGAEAAQAEPEEPPAIEDDTQPEALDVDEDAAALAAASGAVAEVTDQAEQLAAADTQAPAVEAQAEEVATAAPEPVVPDPAEPEAPPPSDTAEAPEPPDSSVDATGAEPTPGWSPGDGDTGDASES